MNRMAMLQLAALHLIGGMAAAPLEDYELRDDEPSKKARKRAAKAYAPLNDKRQEPKEKSDSLRKMLARKGRA